MSDGFTSIKTSQGVIKYQFKEGASKPVFEYKEDNKGRINIFGKDVNVYLPENTASKVTLVGEESSWRNGFGVFADESENVSIFDGAENDGKNYADEIILNGKGNTYEAARKTVNGRPNWALDSQNGDNIYVNYGTGNKVIAKSGNNVKVSEDASGTIIEAHQGTRVDDHSGGTDIYVKESPHMKNGASAVDVYSHTQWAHATVHVEPGTLLATDDRPTVVDQNGKYLGGGGDIDNDGHYCRYHMEK